MRDELRPVAQQGASDTQVGLRAEGSGSPAVAVQGLDPLAIQPIAFAAWETLEGRGADQATRPAAPFQCLAQRDPGHTSGFQCHSGEAVFQSPRGNGVQVDRVMAERTHHVGVVCSWNADHKFMGADVDSGSRRLDARYALEGSGFTVFPAIGVTTCAHESLL